MASIFPTTLSLAERRMMITGRVTGWFFVGVGAGAMTIPWMVGQLFEGIGPQVLLIALALDFLFAFGLYIWLISISNRTAEIYTSSE
jgi:fucose permease